LALAKLVAIISLLAMLALAMSPDWATCASLSCLINSVLPLKFALPSKSIILANDSVTDFK
jgi:hypothetical protein